MLIPTDLVITVNVSGENRIWWESTWCKEVDMPYVLTENCELVDKGGSEFRVKSSYFDLERMRHIAMLDDDDQEDGTAESYDKTKLEYIAMGWRMVEERSSKATT